MVLIQNEEIDRMKERKRNLKGGDVVRGNWKYVIFKSCVVGSELKFVKIMLWEFELKLFKYFPKFW